MTLTNVDIPAGGSVTLDTGTHASIFVQNIGNKYCTILPAGVRISPGETATVPVSADVAVYAVSVNGTTVGYKATGAQTSSTPTLATKLIDRVEQRIGQQAITTTSMTTWPGIILNVPVVDSDVEITVEFPYMLYQNGVTASTPGTLQLILQLVDDLGNLRIYDTIATRALPASPDAFATLAGVYRKSCLIDRQASARYYQMQFQVNRNDMNVLINQTWSGVGGLTLQARAVD